MSLIGFSRTKAVFSLTPKGLDVYSSEHGPFCYNTQFDQALQILTMTLENFVKFSEDLGDPGKIISEENVLVFI